ncbi:hypothetical protein EON77_02060, partial [bacterium]
MASRRRRSGRPILRTPERPPPRELGRRMTSAGPTDHRGREVFVGEGEMARLINSMDWSKTAVGPVSTWPQSLKVALSVCIGSKFPMFVWWGPELTVFYNDGYAPILGAAKHPRFLGGSARDQWAEVWDTLGPLVDQVMQTGTATWFEDFHLFPVIRRGFPEDTYFTFSYSPIRDESGDVVGVFNVVQETTKRVLGDRRLRTLRELAERTSGVRAVGDAARGMMSVLDGNASDVPFALTYLVQGGAPSRLVLEATTKAARAGAMIPSEIALGGGRDAFSRSVVRALEEGKAVVFDEASAMLGELVPDPETDRARACVILPITASDQEQPAAGVLIVGVNPRLPLDDDYLGYLALVSGQLGTALATARGHEEERNRAEALAAIDRAKTTFFSNVSHELRTPLTLMLGPIDDGLADEREPLAPAQRERQELVRRSGRRLQKLVNTLLDFARIEAGRASAAFAPVDLSAVTIELVSSFQSAFASAGVALVVDCPRLPEPVFVDPAMWEKIVLNLISNAFKFTFEGEVRVALTWLGDRVVLTVRDTGTGIAPQEIARLFERFHRVEGARGRSHEGTGIGLALVKELTQLHRGDVEVASVVGEGTTFTVTLKTGTSHLPLAQVGPSAPALSATPTGVDAFLAEVSQWNDAETPPRAPASAPEPRVASRPSAPPSTP